MNVIYATLSEDNSVAVGDEVSQCDTYINIPQPLNLREKAICLTDIEGYVTPLIKGEEKSFYLCSDFVEPSMLQLKGTETVGMFPIIRRITFDKNGKVKIPNGQEVDASIINEHFGKYLFLPCSRNRVPSFRLYLINGQGDVVSFKNFALRCTLLSL